LKLSPAMVKFAECCKLGFDANKLASKGISIGDYNKEIRDWNQKDTLGGLSTTDAGALVPIEFLATVIEFAVAQSLILPKLWRVPMGSSTLRIPTLSQTAGSYFGGIVLYHPDELASKTTTEPTFSYKEFSAKKLIGLIPLSDELIADSAINMVNYITGLFVRAFQYKTEGEVISGTGASNQMTGILADTSINLVSRQTNLQVKFDDIMNLESALDENFQNLTWMTRRATANYLRKQKDTVGQPIYQYPWPPMATGGQILEYPVIKTRNLPALGLKGDIILGDLGYYIWAVRQDMTIDMSRDRYFEYDATALRFVVRQDGKPGVSIAFAALNSTPAS
jgi:HK97 family phage major capsid protein